MYWNLVLDPARVSPMSKGHYILGIIITHQQKRINLVCIVSYILKVLSQTNVGNKQVSSAHPHFRGELLFLFQLFRQ